MNSKQLTDNQLFTTLIYCLLPTNFTETQLLQPFITSKVSKATF